MQNDLPEYCLAHTTPVEPALAALERRTHLTTLYPQMLAGPYQGMLLQFVSRMIAPRRVLEIGTFTGYSAICLAQGLCEGGLLHTIEIDDERAPLIGAAVAEAGLSAKIRLHLGDAADIVPGLDEVFDLVYLDAGKLDYRKHYELVLPKVRPGGFLLADNVLWGGQILHAPADPTVEALRAFNDYVHADPRVDNILLPLRDGLMLLRKR